MYSSNCLCIISCGKTKQEKESLAKDLYKGTDFVVRKEFAEKNFLNWVILSAKYGVLKPEEKVKPYNVYINDLSVTETEELFTKAANQVHEFFPHCNEFYLVVPAGYASFAKYLDSFGKVIMPLDGLTGRQKLHFLKTGDRVKLDIDDVLNAVINQLSSGAGYKKKVLVNIIASAAPSYSVTYINRIIDCSTVNNFSVRSKDSIKRRSVFYKLNGLYYLVGTENVNRLF